MARGDQPEDMAGHTRKVERSSKARPNTHASPGRNPRAGKDYARVSMEDDPDFIDSEYGEGGGPAGSMSDEQKRRCCCCFWWWLIIILVLGGGLLVLFTVVLAPKGSGSGGGGPSSTIPPPVPAPAAEKAPSKPDLAAAEELAKVSKAPAKMASEAAPAARSDLVTVRTVLNLVSPTGCDLGNGEEVAKAVGALLGHVGTQATTVSMTTTPASDGGSAADRLRRKLLMNLGISDDDCGDDIQCVYAKYVSPPAGPVSHKFHFDDDAFGYDDDGFDDEVEYDWFLVESEIRGGKQGTELIGKDVLAALGKSKTGALSVGDLKKKIGKDASELTDSDFEYVVHNAAKGRPYKFKPGSTGIRLTGDKGATMLADAITKELKNSETGAMAIEELKEAIKSPLDDDDFKDAVKEATKGEEIFSLNGGVVDLKQKPAPKPATEPAPKPAPEPATKPAPEPAAKPALEPAAKPIDTVQVTVDLTISLAKVDLPRKHGIASASEFLSLTETTIHSSAKDGTLDKKLAQLGGTCSGLTAADVGFDSESFYFSADVVDAGRAAQAEKVEEEEVSTKAIAAKAEAKANAAKERPVGVPWQRTEHAAEAEKLAAEAAAAKAEMEKIAAEVAAADAEQQRLAAEAAAAQVAAEKAATEKAAAEKAAGDKSAAEQAAAEQAAAEQAAAEEAAAEKAAAEQVAAEKAAAEKAAAEQAAAEKAAAEQAAAEQAAAEKAAAE
eukprot:CAMPEP_0172647452 /NCGR_PEP_ID=MMETSP1068-20121228/240759_1 /TAXON_ID=35684 /ORGANISM="Pseudopedinella elastica, Strain CCMP716" /LENGTH=724 /DNA_ID=CAMNT_0013461733 /DNA_START=95 /DNA_END=2266 /DNA_ORIENTATION=-